MKAIAAILAFVTLGLGVTASDGPAAAARRPAGNARPNIVFILTDDQRWDSLAPVQKPDGTWVRPMPNVDDLLAAKGMTLTNYFLSDPLCCPSRSSILRGLYPHGTQVYSNDGPWGGYDAFLKYHNDASNIATWLQGALYRTGLVGKLLNGYEPADAGAVLPGWDEWNVLTSDNYFKVSESVNGVKKRFPPNAYQTDILGAQAIRFVESTPAGQPLFLYWAPHAPHGPATPAPQDVGSFDWLPHYRPASFNEKDISDKPPNVRRELLDAERIAKTDLFREHQYESLQSVDRWIGAIVDSLERTGRLSNTLIIFSSDNGMMYAEHRFAQLKNVAYEESTRSPFIARWDGMIPPASIDNHLAVNVDIAPSLARAAGVRPDYAVDGASLLPILGGDYDGVWRHAFLIEHSGGAGAVDAYCAVRTDAGFAQVELTFDRPYVYVWYFGTKDDEEELYDLTADPDELNNIASDDTFAGVVSRLHKWVDARCIPRPPKFG